MNTGITRSAPTDPAPAPRFYPPFGHVLRHVGLDQRFQPNGDLLASMPATDDLRDAGGAVRVGALVILVDSAAGVLSHERVRPDWLATTDMKYHSIRPTTGEGLDSVTRILRPGKRNILSQTILTDVDGEIGRAWVTYARLPRRDDTPTVESDDGPNQRLHYTEDPEFERGGRLPLDDYIGMRIRASELVIEVTHNDRIRNSFGSIQGGVAAALVERMGTLAAERALGAPARSLDIHLHYLGQSTTGPFRIDGTILRVDGDTVTTEVTIIDAGDGRVLDLGTTTARAIS